MESATRRILLQSTEYQTEQEIYGPSLADRYHSNHVDTMVSLVGTAEQRPLRRRCIISSHSVPGRGWKSSPGDLWCASSTNGTKTSSNVVVSWHHCTVLENNGIQQELVRGVRSIGPSEHQTRQRKGDSKCEANHRLATPHLHFVTVYCYWMLFAQGSV